MILLHLCLPLVCLLPDLVLLSPDFSRLLRKVGIQERNHPVCNLALDVLIVVDLMAVAAVSLRCDLVSGVDEPVRDLIDVPSVLAHRVLVACDVVDTAQAGPVISNSIWMKYSIAWLVVGFENASEGSAAWSFWTYGSEQIHSLPSFTPSLQRANIQPMS